MLEFKQSGHTISLAIENGLKKLGLGQEDVQICVLRAPKNFSDAVIVLKVSDEVVAKNPHLKNLPLDTEKTKSEFGELLATAEKKVYDPLSASTPEEAARLFVCGFLQEGGIRSFKVEVKNSDGQIYVDATGRALGHLIGRASKGLGALQVLVNQFLSQHFENSPKAYVDFNGHKQNLSDRLAARARKVCEEVIKTGQPYTFEPMNAFLRRIVHNEVAKFDGAVVSESSGEPPNRKICISCGA